MLLKRDAFAATLARHGLPALRRRLPTTLQVNLGKLCNQACRHCHVDAGPTRTELMDAATAERVLAVVQANPSLVTVDITGGAPELNPRFRDLVRGVRAAGRRVMVRCNLTVLFEPGQDDLPAFYAEHGVHVVASLPCYTEDNVDQQRGGGVFDKSVEAIRRLNAAGYGAAQGGDALPADGAGALDGDDGDPRVGPDGAPLRLDLVYNPLGPFLPPPQEALEADYRARLAADHGLRFDRLLALANMPIHRFAEDLERQGKLGDYETLLRERFNPAAVDDLMCRDLLSVDWDGTLADCDFHQMLDLPLGAGAAGDGAGPRTVFELDDLSALTDAPVTTADHCLGCTAGQGSSCGGALAADAG